MTARRAPAPYPLDHGRGYCPLPRDVASFEPLMRNGNLLRLLVVLYTRARHTAGWAAGSHGNVWLERGQCVCGVREIAATLDLNKNTVQKELAELERLGLIARNAGQRGSVICIVNYASFGENDDSDRDSHQDTDQDSNKDSHWDTDQDSNKDSHRDSNEDSHQDSNEDSHQDTDRDSQEDTDRDSHQDSEWDLRNGRTGRTGRTGERTAPLTLSLPLMGDVKGSVQGAGHASLHGQPESADRVGRRLRARKPPRKAAVATPEQREIAARVIAELARASGFSYEPTATSNVTKVVEQLGAGRSEADLLAVVRDRADDWRGEEKTRRWLRPETLFGPKFETYLAQARASGAAAARTPADGELEDARRRAAERSRGMPAFDEPLAGGKR